MKNLESILAENMRRFNTKNLNEQDFEKTSPGRNLALDVKAAMTTLKPGYNMVSGQRPLTLHVDKRKNSSFFAAHVLLSGDRRNLLVFGPSTITKRSSDNSEEELKKSNAPAELVLISYPSGYESDSTEYRTKITNMTFENAFEYIVQWIDPQGIVAGGSNWLSELKLSKPTTLTAESIVAFITKLDPTKSKNLMSNYVSKKTALNSMLNI
jgi:hypothetical protein